jgi:hypothetical protein
MSAFYDQASLVVVPSGYKSGKIYAQKPLTTDGQLTFTRASNATRVASNGLIEKVRTNLLLQSNTFSTTWANDNTTETSGQAGYDGTNNAWLISKSASGGSIYQTGLSSSSLQTFSLYAKQGTSTWISMTILGGSNPRTSFDLVNGVVGTLLGGAISAKIESVGNGWYRCSVVASVSGSGVYIYPSEGDGVTTATSGTLIIQNAQLEASDIATDYIATTTAAVSVGPVSGLPRLDYPTLGQSGSCPRLLLEPQRSNLITFSEQIDNAAWNKGAATITANAAVSPDGTTNADAIVDTATNAEHNINQTVSITANAVTTFSVFLKSGTQPFAMLRHYGANGQQYFCVVVDLNAGTITKTQAGTSTTSTASSITNYGNGWYRVTATCSFASTTAIPILQLVNSATPTIGSFGDYAYLGNGTNSIFAWGFQLEQAPYATSYIPTLGTSVTRVADVASKTGISSLIGQTEGTLFIEGSALQNGSIDSRRISISDGSTNNRITIEWDEDSNRIRAFMSALGVTVGSTSYTGINQTNNSKIAVTYNSSAFSMFINGVKVDSDTTIGTTPIGMAQFNFSAETGLLPFQGNAKQLLIFPTALTDGQAIELTSL